MLKKKLKLKMEDNLIWDIYSSIILEFMEQRVAFKPFSHPGSMGIKNLEWISDFVFIIPDCIFYCLYLLICDVPFCLAVDGALCHPYLAPLHNINEEPVCPMPFNFDFDQPSFTEENIKELIWLEALKFNPDPTHWTICRVRCILLKYYNTTYVARKWKY